MSGVPSISTQPPSLPSSQRTRSEFWVSLLRNSPSGTAANSTETLLTSIPSPRNSPRSSASARPVRTWVTWLLTWTWVKACCLLMSAHTSPLRKQIRPSSGKSSESLQRRNDFRSVTHRGTYTSTSSVNRVGMVPPLTATSYLNGPLPHKPAPVLV